MFWRVRAVLEDRPGVDPLDETFGGIARQQVMSFDHDRLDVYQRALELLDLTDRIIDAMPSGRAHLKDQLDRAATSIVLNVAEGAGEFSLADKQRFYRIARRSATESAAILDIIRRRGNSPPDLLAQARDGGGLVTLRLFDCSKPLIAAINDIDREAVGAISARQYSSQQPRFTLFALIAFAFWSGAAGLKVFSPWFSRVP